MKCKQAGKRKPCMSPMVGAEDGFQEAVCSNAEANSILDYYENDQFTSPKETEVPSVSKKTKIMLNTSPWGFSTSKSKPNKKTESTQVDNTNKKNSELARQDPQFNKRELYSALEVIRNIMKMDAAQPFIVPVDPVAMKIPDYFNIIDTPMDFGTICANLENGVKYKNARDVLNDVQYIWQNFLKYNKKRHYILELMKRVKENFTKYWTEAGLFVEEPKERNGEGCSHLTLVMPTGVHSPFGHGSHDGPYAGDPNQCRLNEGQSQCQRHQHQPSLSKGSYQWQPSADSVERRHPYDYSYTTDPFFDRLTRMYPNQPSVDLTYCPPSQPSLSCKLPVQPQHKSFQRQQSFQRPLFFQADDGIDLSSSEEHFPSPPPMGSMIRSSEHGPSSRSFQSHQFSSHSEPSHPQALTDKEEHLCSLSPVDSMRRCSKHGPTHHASQTNAIDKHDDLLVSRQIVTPQPSDPQAGTNKEEENFRSTPIAESMIRCTKRGSKRPVGPMNAIDECEGQVVLSQMDRPQPSSNSGGPSQHPDVTSQVWLSSSQPQPSCSQANTADGRVGERLTKEKARGRPHGRNRCLEVLNSTEKIPVDVNEFGQAVGSEAPKLTSFLGMIARDGTISPLNYLDWRALPDENKERMWQDVLFDIDPDSKSWVLKSIGKKWKDWKAELKATHYNTHETDKERIADRDERVLPDQWRVLVSFWNSQEAKERSARNKAIRAHQQTSHAAGKKSFARVREEERRKRPDGKPPSRTEMYILTRTKKNGHPVNAAASAVISKLRETAQQQEATEGCSIQDDVFTQVMGRDRHGYVRTFGLGPSPSDLGGPSRAEAEAMKMAVIANAEVKEIEKKMVLMEQICAQMETQIAAMMSTMSHMQKKLSDKDDVADVSVDSGALPSASVQGVSPNQNQASRSKTQRTSTSKGLQKKS